MNPTAEDLHHGLDQLRLLASETDDPLAQRLVRDLIVETRGYAEGSRRASERQRGPSAASAPHGNEA
jgi:hypothetical protein